MNPNARRKLSRRIFWNRLRQFRTWPLVASVLLLAVFVAWLDPRHFVRFVSVEVLQIRTHQTQYGTRLYAFVQMPGDEILNLNAFPADTPVGGRLCVSISKAIFSARIAAKLALPRDCET